MEVKNRKEYMKEYFIMNKENISRRESERIFCDCCKCDIIRVKKLRHESSKKHKKNALNTTKLPVCIQCLEDNPIDLIFGH